MNRFRELRIQHGFKTQKDLAAVLYVNQTAVSQWERGATTPSTDMLKRLSQMYGVSVDYLLGADPAVDATPTDEESREAELSKIFDDLTDENKEKLLELARLYSASQKEK